MTEVPTQLSDPSHRILFKFLLGTTGRYIKSTELVHVVYSIYNRPNTASKQVSRLLCAMRAKLKGTEWELLSLRHPTGGYKLCRLSSAGRATVL